MLLCLYKVLPMGHMTLLVQRAMELPVLEVLLILLHTELLDCPSHLGDRLKDISSRVHCLQTGSIEVVLKQKVTEHYNYHAAFFFGWLCCLVSTWVIIFPFLGHQSTVLRNDASPPISCSVHVSMYHMHTHVDGTSSTKSCEKKWQTMMWCIDASTLLRSLLTYLNYYYQLNMLLFIYTKIGSLVNVV